MKRRSLVASLVSSLAAILILAAGCGEQSPTATHLAPTAAAGAQGVGRQARTVYLAEHLSKNASALITPAGGIIDFGIGRIEFPAGAVEYPVWITAAASSNAIAVELEPHGLAFPAGHEPLLSFTYRDVPANAGTLQILYVDDTRRILEALPTGMDDQGQTYTTRLHHFSGYLLGSW